MSFCNTHEGSVLNRIFTDTAIVKDGPGGTDGTFNYSTDGFYISLHTNSPGETGSLTNEVSGTGYSRKAIAFTALTAVGNTISNSGAVEWASIGGTWSGGSDITHFGIHLGNPGTPNNPDETMIAYGSFTVGKPATSGDTVTIALGDIDISLD